MEVSTLNPKDCRKWKFADREEVQGINSKILVWARETAGMSLEEASKKLSKNIDHLVELENGNRNPTRNILSKMSAKYRRPLLTFYLEEPPQKGKRGQDFRTLPPDYCQKDEALLDALVRDIKSRQYLVRAVLEDYEAEAITFIDSVKPESISVDYLVFQIKHHLKIDINEYREQKDKSAAFRYLRNKVEASGIFVLLAGDLGSSHSKLSPKIFRGFADADPIAPFIVINDKDAPAAWSFTLLHELAHLWLGESGISAGYGEANIEQLCNEVAARILLPTSELEQLNIFSTMPYSDIKHNISQFANQKHLNRAMVAYRLYKAGQITKSLWSRITEEFYTEGEEFKARQKERDKDKEG